jgi:monoamine oxidase
MPRTPVGSFIRRMAQDARKQREGKDASDFRSRHLEVDRRTFLAVGGLGLGAAAIGITGAEASESALNDPATIGDSDELRTRPGAQRVVIIGAGLGGLTCAYELRKRGITAEVWEASGRLGGRCLSDRTAFGPAIIERGGELIDTGHVAVIGLIQELGLQLDDLAAATAPRTPSFYFDGAPYTLDDATRDFAGELYDRVQADAEASGYPVTYQTANDAAVRLDHLSTRQWINSRVPGGVRSKLGRLLDIAYTIEYGLPTSEQSSLTLLSLLSDTAPDAFTEFGASDERYKVRGGNDLIVRELAAHLPEQIVVNTTLTRIRRKHYGYELVAERNGRKVREIASHLVLALPFSILRENVDYEGAGFKPLKLRAIRELRMGANTKLHVETTGRPWADAGNDGSTYADTGYQATWESTRNQPDAAGVMVNFSGGDYALTFATGDPGRRAKLFARQFEPVAPGFTEQLTGRATIDYWPGNPYSRGSYSAWKVGQVTAWAGVEGEPEGNVFFCGEHTSIENQGYLEGAVESGQRAAEELTRSIG